MIVERTVTYLEMTSPIQLRPTTRTADVDTTLWCGSVGMLKSVHDEIGSPHRWPSLVRSEDDWRKRLADKNVEVLAFVVSGEIAGLAEWERQPPGEVELTIFGLCQAFKGGVSAGRR